MRIPIYQIDAFAERLFTGNPAAVVITEEELPSRTMQAIASENNLAETAFVYGDLNSPSIRWFTPTVEVDLCGHATLAAAHVMFMHSLDGCDAVSFSSRSGLLRVFRSEGLLWLDFPRDRVEPFENERSSVTEALQCDVDFVFKGRSDILAILPSQSAVEGIHPKMDRIKQLRARGLIVSAKGDNVDFVSRFFAPQSGIPEDPVTGSAHTTLTPYWSAILGKNEMNARQLSTRGGRLRCRMKGERVHIGGGAITYLEGRIDIDIGRQDDAPDSSRRR
jgi:PhzF family phenazine biosynthesis protein